MAKDTGATKAELVKFVKEEIAQTEEALGFVETALASGNLQFNGIYQRKRAEYSGALWAYNAVLDLAEGREQDNGDSGSGGAEVQSDESGGDSAGD